MDGVIKIGTKIDTKGAEKGIADLQGKLKSAGGKMKSAGTAMSVAVTAPLVALGTMAVKSADTLDKAYNNIQVGTGATGKDLDKLKDSFKEVFKNVPADADAVSNALANLNTYTGATGDSLEEMTSKVMRASNMLGEDGVANSEAFGKAMKQWKIPTEQGGQALDGLFKLTQDYGVSLGGLSGQLTEFGPVLANAGFSMEETAHFMASMESEGISMSRVMPALNASFRKWAGEGKNSRKEFEKVIDTIKNTEDSQEALALATEVFGAEGAQRLMKGIRNGAIPAFDELGGVMEGTQGHIDKTYEDTETLGKRFERFKNETTTNLEPIGRIFLDLAEKWIPPLIEKVQAVMEWFNNLSPTAQKVIVVIGAIAAAIGPVLVVLGSLITAITPVIAIITKMGGVMGLLLNPITMGIALVASLATVIIYYWDEIWAVTKEVFTWIGEFFVTFWEWLKETWNESVEKQKQMISDAWTWISETTSSIWNGIKDFFVELWTTISEFFTETIDAIVKFIVDSWQKQKEESEKKFKELSTFFTNIWNTIKETFTNVIKAVIKFVTDSWNNIKNTTSNIFSAIKSTISKWVNDWKNTITNIVNNIKNSVVKIWNNLKDTTSNVFNKIGDVVSKVWNGIKNTSSSIWNGIKNTVSGVANGLKNSISNAFNSIKSTISNVWNGVKSTTDRIWDGIVRAVKGAINGVIGAINGMINGLNRIKIKLPKVPDWVPGMGGRGGNTLGFSIPNIPKLNIGTDLITQDGLAMLHAGEAVVPAEHNGAYTGEGNGKSKQPAQINLVIGGKTYSAFVEDITDEQDRQNYRLKKK
ncbi:phage tail tape measure protein [Oceanobacillus sp. 1P07AA]|uniref:phage tail tape measure protein n=1 Tax=Oceanobacillus sp. 1P07AA TaxID=3132293 RepID=UPI0039A628B0